MSIESTKAGFEASFKESAFYNRQTQDDKHLNDIIELLDIKPGMKILDLGCGSGYLTFELARVTGTTKSSEATTITGLDIEEVLAKHDKAIIDSYELTQTENEIWVTEQVNNLLFELGRDRECERLEEKYLIFC